MEVKEEGLSTPGRISPPWQGVDRDGADLAQCKRPATASWGRPPGQPVVPLNSGIQESSRIQVSVILPVYNAECWLDECLKSVLEQDFQGSIELSVFNDASTDNSMNIIEKWKVPLEEVGIQVHVGGHCSPCPRGASLMSQITACDIYVIVISDHAPISLVLQFPDWV